MKICIALLSVLITGISFSQQRDSIKKNPRFIIKMTHGMTSSSQFDFTNSEWDRMTPGYDIPDSLKSGISGTGYDSHEINTISSSQYYMFSFSLINGADKQAGRKFLATTTFHLGYGPELNARKTWYHENKQVIDTLTSNQNGQEFYIYGNRNQLIAKSYNSRSIAIGIGEHIATNPNRIFQFETGLDVLCLLSITSEVNASYVDNYFVEGQPIDYNNVVIGYPSPQLTETRAETFSGNFTAGLIMRVPFEMSFKLSRNNPVLSRMRIGGELNPGLGMQFTKGLISSSVNISGGMNFRFAF